MSHTVTSLKLDARRKHFAQLVARSNGLTLAELVDALLDDYLAQAALEEDGQKTAVAELMSQAWGEHEADRLALLGNRFPALLTDRERVLWQRIICATSSYWKVPLPPKGAAQIVVSEQTFDFAKFRERLGTYDGLTRDEIIVSANQFEKQRRNAEAWHGDGPKQKAFRKELKQRREKQYKKITHKPKHK